MKHLLTCVFAAVMLFSMQPANAAPASQTALCFDQPGIVDCIDVRFVGAWSQHGGLPVFGFPISSADLEYDPATNGLYGSQWYERNRLELHPENAAPYDVLLGRLGDDRLRQMNYFWELKPRESGPQDGCLWFAETGHNVCNQSGALGFRSYWESHGLNDARMDSYQRSLALFGYPLTEARMETNANGDTVLTQWFERARFEWHPDQSDQYKVLLGLLGKEIREAAVFATPPAISGECAANAPALEEGAQAWLTTAQPAAQTTLCVRVVVRGNVVRDGVFSGYVRYRAATQPWLGPVPIDQNGLVVYPLDLTDAPHATPQTVDVAVTFLRRIYRTSVTVSRP
jgi:hypothetical protein